MAIQEKYGDAITRLQASHAVEITAGETVYGPSTLFVGTAGNVTVTTAGGEAGVVFKNLANGAILPVLVTAVTAASAEDLILLS
jgi:hypothetical protein